MHWSFQLISCISPAWPTSGIICSARKPPSLSYEKWDLPSRGLLHRVICGSWSLMKCFAIFFTPRLIGAGLVLCWAPQGVSAHFQKCCWLLSEVGYLLNYYSLNSKTSMPFQHNRAHCLPSAGLYCSEEQHKRGVGREKAEKRGVTTPPPCQGQRQGRSHSTFCHGGY